MEMRYLYLKFQKRSINQMGTLQYFHSVTQSVDAKSKSHERSPYLPNAIKILDLNSIIFLSNYSSKRNELNFP